MTTILKQFSLLLTLLLLLSIQAAATDLSIQSTVIDWNDGRTTGLEIWIFSDQPWTDIDGTQHGAGNYRDRTFTKRVSGLTNNTSTHRLTIPAFSLTPTLNAIRGNSVRYSFWIMQVIGQNVTPIKAVPGSEDGFQIPATLTSISGCGPAQGTCATWADLSIVNSPSPPLPRDTYYTRSDIDRLLATFGGGGSPGGSGGEVQVRATVSTFGALTGSSSSGADLTLGGKLTIPSTGVVLDAGISNLINILGLTTNNPGRLGLTHGTDASPINSDAPTLSFIRYDRTTGAGNGTTTPWFFGARIKDGGTKLAYYNMMNFVESEDTNVVNRDIVGNSAQAVAKVGSTSRAIGYYSETTIFNNALGQGAYNEFKVVNASGVDSPVPTSALPPGFTLGLQITGGGGKLNTIGIGLGGGGTSAFRVGINYAADVIAVGGYGIDFRYMTQGNAIRLGNNQPLLGYIGGLDRKLIQLNTSGVVRIDDDSVSTSFGGGIRPGPGAFIAGLGQVYTTAGAGLIMTAGTGSNTDLLIASRLGTTLMANPAGTNDFRIATQSNGYIYQNVPNGAPVDANLDLGAMSFYLNEAGNLLTIRIRYSTGAYHTVTIAIP